MNNNTNIPPNSIVLSSGAVQDTKTGRFIKQLNPAFNDPKMREYAQQRRKELRAQRTRKAIIEAAKAGATPDQAARMTGETLGDAIQIVTENHMETIVLNTEANASARTQAWKQALEHADLAVEARQAGQQAQTINNIVVSDAAFEQMRETMAIKQGDDA
jgi:hypothetical protein